MHQDDPSVDEVIIHTHPFAQIASDRLGSDQLIRIDCVNDEDLAGYQQMFMVFDACAEAWVWIIALSKMAPSPAFSRLDRTGREGKLVARARDSLSSWCLFARAE